MDVSVPTIKRLDAKEGPSPVRGYGRDPPGSIAGPGGNCHLVDKPEVKRDNTQAVQALEPPERPQGRGAWQRTINRALHAGQAIRPLRFAAEVRTERLRCISRPGGTANQA